MMKELAAIRGLLRAGVPDVNHKSGAIGRVADITLDLLDTASPTEIAQTVHS
jgi:hypothetical protein